MNDSIFSFCPRDPKRFQKGQRWSREGNSTLTSSALIIPWLGRLTLMMIKIFASNVPENLLQSKIDLDLFGLKPVVYPLGHTTPAYSSGTVLDLIQNTWKTRRVFFLTSVASRCSALWSQTELHGSQWQKKGVKQWNEGKYYLCWRQVWAVPSTSQYESSLSYL